MTTTVTKYQKAQMTMRGPAVNNPYGISSALLPVWEALGRPALHGDKPWQGRVLITQEMAEGLKPFLESRNTNGTFTRSLINRHLAAMRAGEWLDYTDTIIIVESGSVIQGNHRILATAEHNRPVGFLFTLGVVNAARQKMGIVVPWSKCDLIGETKETAGMATVAVRHVIGSMTSSLGHAYHSDCKAMSIIYRSEIEAVIGRLPARSRHRRYGIAMALTEGRVIDKMMNGSTAKSDLFIAASVGDFDARCRWGALHGKYAQCTSDGGTNASAKDYHSTVLLMKRAFLDYDYKVDSRGRHPEKESTTCSWGDMSSGKSLEEYLELFLATRIRELQSQFPDFGDGTTVIPKLINRLNAVYGKNW